MKVKQVSLLLGKPGSTSKNGPRSETWFYVGKGKLGVVIEIENSLVTSVSGSTLKLGETVVARRGDSLKTLDLIGSLNSKRRPSKLHARNYAFDGKVLQVDTVDGGDAIESFEMLLDNSSAKP